MFNQVAKMSMVLLIVAGSRIASAQECPLGWAQGPLLADIRGADGPVHAMIQYDPPGVLPLQLIVGGEFTHIGSIAANNVAAWDGNVWRPLDVGTDGPVLALTTYNNNLIAAGDFGEAGGLGSISRYVAAWNGSDWFMLTSNPLGDENNPDDNRYATKLVVYNGQLIVGGRFDIPLTGPSVLVRLNGASWESIALQDWTDAPQVLQVFDEDGSGPAIPLLYADCNNTLEFWVRWNGSTWQTLFPHPTGFADASMISNDGMVVAGSFTHIYLGDFRWNNALRIAAWDGSDWIPFGTGIGGAEFEWGEKVTAIRQYGNDLYVAGHFSEAGRLPCVNMARWDGDEWFPTGNFFSGEGYEDIHDMRVHAGNLIAGGNFNLADPFGEVNNLATFDGQNWKAFTMPVRVNALSTIGPSQLVLGGSFGQTYDEEDQQTLQHLATWNGLKLAPLSGGVNGPVRALKSYTGGGTNHLVVGGEFTLVGSEGGGIGLAGGGTVAANRIALWSEPLVFGGGWEAMGDGFNGKVLAVEWLPANQFFGDIIFAAGEFTASGIGSPTFNRVASWSGSPPQWFTMGTGFNGTVRAIKGINSGVINRTVVAGGDFTTASGISANRIAMYPVPNLNGWVAMGNGFNAPVHAIERHNGSWYAAGEFTMSGSTPVSHVARWTGTAWESVGQGINGNIHALKSHEGKLYATGGFAFLVWDGTTWAAVNGALTQGSGLAIQPFKTEIEVGGDFLGAGGVAGGIDTSGLARFRYQGLPWIIQQPVSQVALCHAFFPPEIKVSLSPGYEDVAQYQWFKDGVPLEEGWTGTGSSLVGATSSDTLSVLDASDADEGTYQLTVTTSCGSITSAAVMLEAAGACPPCPLDIAPQPVGDDFINVDDLFMVVASWGACVNCPADVAPPGGNDVVNIDDLFGVINAWGTCP